MKIIPEIDISVIQCLYKDIHLFNFHSYFSLCLGIWLIWKKSKPAKGKWYIFEYFVVMKTTWETTHKTKTRASQTTYKTGSELVKGKQFLLLIKHPPCYSCIQSNPVKLLAVTKEIKHLCKKKKIHCLLRYGYQADCDEDRIIFVTMTSTKQ
jgi:hypothetical protein